MSPDRPNYIPQPLDTSRVRVPESLLSLQEKLAENTHEVWAAGRMREGWTWGPVRDDAHRQHPGLVPYDQLSESEKDYDRRTAMETVKAILALGYEIEPPT